MSLGQMQVGLLGMRRRIGDYDVELGFQNSHLLITIAGFVIFIAAIIFVYNLVVSARRGEVAEANPWNSRSPEFQLPSPVPVHNYQDQPFEVVGEPYDYGLPEATSRYIEMAAAPAPGD
jgi:cytochrome c oxidase subunit 1